jgi:hypothetical protein
MIIKFNFLKDKDNKKWIALKPIQQFLEIISEDYKAFLFIYSLHELRTFVFSFDL